tara:strand:- start:4241 stop:5260 length:1020 start_codon:yes stop_codon:yes gene_type:complete
VTSATTEKKLIMGSSTVEKGHRTHKKSSKKDGASVGVGKIAASKSKSVRFNNESKATSKTKTKTNTKTKTKTKTTPKKNKKQAEENNGTDEEEEVESDNGTDEELMSDEELQAQDVSEDEDTEKEEKARKSKPVMTPKELEQSNAKKIRRRNTKARRRGYREVAKRGGYSHNYASSNASLDVVVPIVSINETIRAAKWAPGIAEKATFQDINEFKERLNLSLESLPKKAARVLQDHGERYLRKLTTDVMYSMSDHMKTRASAAMVATVTRPLQRIQKYSFVAPIGLVRYSQNEAKGLRLSTLEDESDNSALDKILIKKQVQLRKSLTAIKKAKSVAIAK